MQMAYNGTSQQHPNASLPQGVCGCLAVKSALSTLGFARAPEGQVKSTALCARDHGKERHPMRKWAFSSAVPFQFESESKGAGRRGSGEGRGRGGQKDTN